MSRRSSRRPFRLGSAELISARFWAPEKFRSLGQVGWKLAAKWRCWFLSRSSPPYHHHPPLSAEHSFHTTAQHLEMGGVTARCRLNFYARQAQRYARSSLFTTLPRPLPVVHCCGLVYYRRNIHVPHLGLGLVNALSRVNTLRRASPL
jgi:hypothetical protein